MQDELDIQIESLAFVVEREPNPGWHTAHYRRIDSRRRENYILAYAKSGAADYVIGGKCVSVTKGCVLFFRPDDVHEAKSCPDDPWSFCSCSFTLRADAASLAALERLPNVFRSSGSAHMLECFTELDRVWSAKRPGYLIKCRSLLLDILWLLLGDEKRRGGSNAHEQTIERIAAYLGEHIDRTCPPGELAEMAGLSPSYFRQLFRQTTGMTTVQYQNRLRVDKAKDLILSGACTVTEAAEATGFSDVSYFSRLFRKMTGRNPSEYIPRA